MKILFVIPRYQLTNKARYDYFFPVGLSYISAVVKQENHEVDCLNLNHYDGTIEFLVHNRLNKKNYDIVFTGGFDYTIIEKIINTVKNQDYKPGIILGGPLLTSEAKLILNSLNVDFAVLGEGERTIVKLLECLEKKKDLKEVNGICYRDEKGELIFTKPRELITDLDSIPPPDLEGFEYEKYLENQVSFSNVALLDYPRSYFLLTSRGCPFQCTFCYHSVGYKYRVRSLDSVFEEIELAIKKYKINSLYIYDDLFSIDRKRLFEFCRRLKELVNKYNHKLVWCCQLIVDKNVDEEMLETLKESGCKMVTYGFESFSPTVLKSMKKPTTPEMIESVFYKTLKAGISMSAGFIFGDIAETKETAKETLDWWKKHSKGQITLNFIQPYPGCEIYNHCIKKGVIKDKLDFIKNTAYTRYINTTDNMTDEEYLDLKKEVIDSLRKYPPYIVPKEIEKTGTDRYKIKVKCPFCKETITYGNRFMENKLFYLIPVMCRKCPHRFYVISPLKKFHINHYQKLDFFRNIYNKIKKSILKQRL